MGKGSEREPVVGTVRSSDLLTNLSSLLVFLSFVRKVISNI